jgi:hypothetical protein
MVWHDIISGKFNSVEISNEEIMFKNGQLLIFISC